MTKRQIKSTIADIQPITTYIAVFVCIIIKAVHLVLVSTVLKRSVLKVLKFQLSMLLNVSDMLMMHTNFHNSNF